MKKSSDIAILILAGGSSSRLGMQKQLLKIKSKTLLEIAIIKALKLTPNVNVVLGHESKECIQYIRKFRIDILINQDYKKGIGSSISYGIKNINSKKVLIMLCDMPFVPLSHLKKMLKLKTNLIVCSKYKNQLATPAIFPHKYFNDLKKLYKDEGAKKLIKKYNTISKTLESKYAIDIDTKKDLIYLDIMNINN